MGNERIFYIHGVPASCTKLPVTATLEIGFPIFGTGRSSGPDGIPKRRPHTPRSEPRCGSVPWNSKFRWVDVRSCRQSWGEGRNTDGSESDKPILKGLALSPPAQRNAKKSQRKFLPKWIVAFIRHGRQQDAAHLRVCEELPA